MAGVLKQHLAIELRSHKWVNRCVAESDRFVTQLPSTNSDDFFDW